MSRLRIALALVLSGLALDASAMQFLRTNTAVIITVGPFYDKTDGVTIKGSLTITNERITLTADTDAGSAPTNILDNVTGATSGTSNDLNYITGNDAGMMQMELAAADVNRLGRMFLTITDAANHVPVFAEFEVVPALVYDTYFASSGGATFPAATLASTTNITAGTGIDVTKWNGTTVATPATAGIPDVNTKNINNVAAATPGASGGVLISGTNSGTTTLGALTVTGSMTVSDGLLVSRSSSNTSAITATGNGTGSGIVATSGSGATGDGMQATAASTNGTGLKLAGVGTEAGLKSTGGATGQGLLIVGGGTSGDGVKVTTTSGHGVNLAPVGTSMHGLLATGGNGGTSDGIKAVAGTGGVPIRGDITGNITGTLATLTTYTGNTVQTGDNYARLGAPAGASVSADIAAVKAETASIQADTNLYDTDAEYAAAIWNAGTASYGSAGSYGLLLETDLDAAVSSRSTLTQTQANGGAYALDTDSNGRIRVVDGTGTGELDTASGVVLAKDHAGAALATASALATTQADTDDIQTRLPAALGANGNIKADLRDYLGTASPAADTAGYPKVTIKDGTGTGEIDTTSGGVAHVILADTVTTYTGNTPQTGDVYALANGSSGFVALKGYVDDIGTAGAGLTAIPWNASWDTEVQSECDDALVVERLDELLAADSDIDGAQPPAVGSVFHEALTKTGGSFTYDQATDSPEALRDRGDAAWVTGTLSASDVWAAGTRTLTALDEDSTTFDWDATTVGIATTCGTVNALAANSVTATAVAAGAITSSEAPNLDAAVSTRASATAVDDLPTNAELATSQAAADDATLAAIAALTIPTAAAVADACWDEDMTGHQTQGSAGQVIGDSGSTARSIWAEATADTYQAKVWMTADSGASVDRYTVIFYKNSTQPLSSGITSPTISVTKVSDGTDLVASTAMTQIGSSGKYKYTESTNRLVTGSSYIIHVSATIDGSSRTWDQPMSRE